MAKGKVVITEDNLGAMEEALGLIRSEGVVAQPVSKVADPITLEYDKVFGTLKGFFPDLEVGKRLGNAILKVIKAACDSGGHGDLVFGLAGFCLDNPSSVGSDLTLTQSLREHLTKWVENEENNPEYYIDQAVLLSFRNPVVENGSHFRCILKRLKDYDKDHSRLLEIIKKDSFPWNRVGEVLRIVGGSYGAEYDEEDSDSPKVIDSDFSKVISWFFEHKNAMEATNKSLTRTNYNAKIGIEEWLLKQEEIKNIRGIVELFLDCFLMQGVSEEFQIWLAEKVNLNCQYNLIKERFENRDCHLDSLCLLACKFKDKDFIASIVEKSSNKEDVLVKALAYALQNSKKDLVNAIVNNESFKSISGVSVESALRGIDDNIKMQFISHIVEKSSNKEDVLVYALAYALQNSKKDLVNAIVNNESFKSISGVSVESALRGIDDNIKMQFISHIVEKSSNKEDVLVYALAYAIRNDKDDLVNVIVNNESFKSISGASVKSALEGTYLFGDKKVEFIKHIIEKSANKEDVLQKALLCMVKTKEWKFAEFAIPVATFKSLSGEEPDELITKASQWSEIDFFKFIIEKCIKTDNLGLILDKAIEEKGWEFAKSVITRASSISLTDEQYIALMEMALGNNDKESIKTIIEKSADKEDVLRKALLCMVKGKKWEFAEFAIPGARFTSLSGKELDELITKAFQWNEIEFFKFIIDKASSISLTDEQYRALMEMVFANDNDGEYIKLIIEKCIKISDENLGLILDKAIKENNWEVAKSVITKDSFRPLNYDQYIALITMLLANNDKESIKTIIEKGRVKKIVAQDLLAHALEKKNWEVAKDICKSNYGLVFDQQSNILLEMAVGAGDTDFINLTIGKAKKYLYESTITKVLAYAINNKKEVIVRSILAVESFEKLGDKRFSAVMNAMKMITAPAKDKNDLIEGYIYPVLKEFFIRSYDVEREEEIIENLLMSIPSESEGAAGKIVSSLLVSVVKNNEITAERCGIVLRVLILTRGLIQTAKGIIQEIKDKDDFITSILSKAHCSGHDMILYTLVAGGVKKDKLIELAKKVGVDSSRIKDDPAPQDNSAAGAAATSAEDSESLASVVGDDTTLTRGVEDTPTADATDSPAVSAAATPAEDSESPASVVGDDTTPAEDSESPASVVGDDTTPALSAAATLTAPQVTTAGGAAAPGNDTSVSRSALLRGVPAAGLGAGLTAMGVYTAVLPPVFCVLSPLATVAMGACIFFMVGSLVSALYLGANATELAEQRYNREEGVSLSS
jgi:uncharacterized protein (DUF1778 family)